MVLLIKIVQMPTIKWKLKNKGGGSILEAGTHREVVSDWGVVFLFKKGGGHPW